MVCVEAEEMRRRRGSLDGNDVATKDAVMMWEFKSAFDPLWLDVCEDDGGCPHVGLYAGVVVVLFLGNSTHDTAGRERLALGFAMSP